MYMLGLYKKGYEYEGGSRIKKTSGIFVITKSDTNSDIIKIGGGDVIFTSGQIYNSRIAYPSSISRWPTPNRNTGLDILSGAIVYPLSLSGQQTGRK